MSNEIEEILKDEPAICGWCECHSIVLEGLAYQVEDNEIWHEGCFDSPAGRGRGKVVNLKYRCNMPENFDNYILEKDLKELLRKVPIKTLEEIIPDKKLFYPILIDILSFNHKSERIPISPYNLRLLSKYHKRGGFSEEEEESFIFDQERNRNLSDDARLCLNTNNLCNAKEPLLKLRKISENLPHSTSAKMYEAIADLLEQGFSGADITLLCSRF